MKSITYIHLCCLFCLSLLLGSCSQDDLLYDLEVVEGLPATISLNLGVEANVVSTRTGTDDQESKVYDVVVFIFDAAGKKVSTKYIEAAEYGVELPKTISMSTFTGNNRTIMAIANVTGGIMDVNIEELLQIRDIIGLNKLFAILGQNTVARGRGLLMSGVVKDSKEATEAKKVTVTIGSTAITGTLFLKRLDAKITFRVATESGHPLPSDKTKTVENVVFISDKWKVLNCGKRSRMIHTTDFDASSTDEYFFDTKATVFERDLDNDGSTALPFGSVKFTFYILQSRLQGKQAITATPSTPSEHYSLRTKKDYTTGVEAANAPFFYANNHSPYVELTGTLNYDVVEAVVDGVAARTSISAKVKYTIMLGDGVADPNDYNTNASTHYTYYITLLSAENIIVEVETGTTENQSGAEGTVSQTLQLHEFDAHYETKVITFNTENTRAGLGWYVGTPFETKMYSPESDNIGRADIKDYLWIYFKLNATETIAGTEKYVNSFASYTGETDIYTYSKIGDVPASTDSMIGVYNKDLIADYVLNGKGKLIDIRHLSRILSASNATDDGDNQLFKDGEIKFTAFVDEYYYQKNPLDNSTPADLWKKFTNTRSRTVGLSYNAKASTDGQSLFLKSNIEFSQKAIQSIYNTESRSLMTAWGTESVDDRDQLGWSFPSAIKYKLSPSDGLYNTNLIWGVGDVAASNPSWDLYVDPLDNSLTSTGQKTNYACMRLNRDNNGDGKIDKEEVRWYLASIDQLTNMWVGQNSLHIDSHLYRYGRKSGGSYTDMMNGSTDHALWGEEIYISSSRFEKEGPFSVLWSAEGASVGTSERAKWMPTDVFFYRCLRNLGKDNLVPENIVSYTEKEDVDGTNLYTINLEHLEQNSIRSYKALGDLPAHTERSLDNLPYHAFEVKTSFSLDNSTKWYQITVNQAKNPYCPLGWRLPNQRELVIMRSTLPAHTKEWGTHFSFASSIFSLNVEYNDDGTALRPGFAVSRSNNFYKMVLINDSATRNFTGRCVRDVDPT